LGRVCMTAGMGWMPPAVNSSIGRRLSRRRRTSSMPMWEAGGRGRLWRWRRGRLGLEAATIVDNPGHRDNASYDDS
jgi:hypothetical protein